MSPMLVQLAVQASAAPITDLTEGWGATATTSYSGTVVNYGSHSGAWVSGMDGDGWTTAGTNPNTSTIEPNANVSTSGATTWGSRGNVDDHLTYSGREYRDVSVRSHLYVAPADADGSWSDACGLVVRWQSATDFYLLYSTNDHGPNAGAGGDRSGAGTRLYRIRGGVATEVWSTATPYQDMYYNNGWWWGNNRMAISVSGTSPVSFTIALDRNADGDTFDTSEFTTTVTDSSSERIQTGGRVGMYGYSGYAECNFEAVSVVIDDLDTDLDTVPDARDNCVTVANTAQTDANKNRIGDACEDNDGDGSLPPLDCNDGDKNIYPGATESCDLIDQDCDKDVLEAFPDFDADKTPDCVDPDDDNDGDPDTTDCNDFDKAFGASAVEACDSVDNDCDGDLVDGALNTDGDALPNCVDLDDDGDGSPDTSDCAPLDKTISPLAVEVCDLVDQDCDGDLVESFTNTDGDLQPDCVDADDDGDSFADVADCGPLDASIYPGAPESACDTIDSNCDGSTSDGAALDTDLDGTADCLDLDDDDDFSPDTLDCAPLDKTVYPGAVEVCDLIDQDCDKNVIEAFANTDGDAQPDCVDVDDDGDGSLDTADCRPLDKAVFPGAVEVCDLVDSDCDADLVDGFPDFDKDKTADCVDTDDDNDADPDPTDCEDNNPLVSTKASEACDLVDSNCNGSLVDTFTDFDKDKTPDCVDPDDDDDTESDATDCAPTNPSVSHLTKEVCNGVDDDCSGTIDDAYATGVVTWYADVDLDGVGDDTVFVVACAAPPGFIDQSGDCDDGDKLVNPAAVETCRPGDDDCDGFADDTDPEGAPADTTDWYADRDSDGYGDDKAAVGACIQPDGYTDLSAATDCDDKDSNVNPSALEECENGIDDNCDGKVDETVVNDWWPDEDADGYGDASVSPVSDCASPGAGFVTNGDDCDDDDEDVSPRREELLGNGIDDDCDPSTADVPDTDDPGETDVPLDSAIDSDRPFDSDLVDSGAPPVIGEACGCRAAPSASGVWLLGALLVAARLRPRARQAR